MPELPAMENFRRDINDHALKRKIVAVATVKDRVVKTDAVTLGEKMNGKTLTATRRTGKYVFIRVGAVKDQTWLAFHCGMTGFFDCAGAAGDQKWAKAKLLIEFAAGPPLAFFDPRRFGHVELIEDPDAFIAGHRLGPDANDVDATAFQDKLSVSGKPLKSFFLDQSIIAGIGNVYGDEIPFHARIDPRRRGKDLTTVEIRRLYRSMQSVLDIATKRKASLDNWDMLPLGWLAHARDETASCPRCGQPVQTYKSGGRDGYFCSHCQK